MSTCSIKLFARASFVPVLAGVLIVSAGIRPARAQNCEENSWTRVVPETLPPIVSGGQMAYDSVRERIVLVAPASPTQTWEWDGMNWSVRGTGGPDAGGYGYAAAYDSLRAVTVLYNSRGETWTWNGEQWLLASTVGPVDAYYPQMAFDSDRGVAVMYSAGVNHELWEWDGATWALRDSGPPEGEDHTRPPAQVGVATCYDLNMHQTIVYGGTDYDELDETWAWDGTTWTRLEGGGPHARTFASMTFDTARMRRVLFGGVYYRFGGDVDEFGDTWECASGASWVLVDTTGPDARHSASMIYDVARNNIALTGGIFGTNDTWIRGPEPIHGGPVIDTQPVDQAVDPLGTATFSIVASGEGTITYQWRHNMVPLSDDPHRSGSHSTALTITGVTGVDAGTYDVVVTNPCTSVASDPVTLTVAFCPADFNTDGVANSQDFFDFLNAFFALSPSADFDHSGTVDSSDFFAYLDAFFAGCV